MLEIGINNNIVRFDLLTIIVWVIIGLAAGYLASVVTRRRGTLLSDLIIGILGAFVGGILLSLLAPIISINISPPILRDIITAFLGAIVIILVVRAFSRRR